MKKDKKNTTKKFESKEIKQQTLKNEDYQKVLSFLVILFVVLACLAGLFFFNGKFVTKDKFQDEETTTTTTVAIDNSKITADDIFKQKGSTYYVMMYRTKDKGEDFFYSGLVKSYQGSDKLYTVDLSDKMNSKYYKESGKENTNPTSSKDLSITRPVLLVIQNGKVKSYITDQEEMTRIIRKK